MRNVRRAHRTIRSYQKIRIHEDVRHEGALVVLDTVDDLQTCEEQGTHTPDLSPHSRPTYPYMTDYNGRPAHAYLTKACTSSA